MLRGLAAIIVGIVIMTIGRRIRSYSPGRRLGRGPMGPPLHAVLGRSGGSPSIAGNATPPHLEMLAQVPPV